MNTFELKIIACDRVFFEGECESLTFPAYDGQMQILANHAPMTTAIEVGDVRFKPKDGDWQVAICSDGLLRCGHNKVNIIVYSAERPEEIDAFRAEAALERAKEKLQQKQSIIEYHVSSASLSRAMARLQGKNRYLGIK